MVGSEEDDDPATLMDMASLYALVDNFAIHRFVVSRLTSGEESGKGGNRPAHGGVEVALRGAAGAV
jgi:hypothetical protein